MRAIFLAVGVVHDVIVAVGPGLGVPRLGHLDDVWQACGFHTKTTAMTALKSLDKTEVIFDAPSPRTEYAAFEASVEAAKLNWILACAANGRCLPDSLYARICP